MMKFLPCLYLILSIAAAVAAAKTPPPLRVQLCRAKLYGIEFK